MYRSTEAWFIHHRLYTFVFGFVFVFVLAHEQPITFSARLEGIPFMRRDPLRKSFLNFACHIHRLGCLFALYISLCRVLTVDMSWGTLELRNGTHPHSTGRNDQFSKVNLCRAGLWLTLVKFTFPLPSKKIQVWSL